MKPDKSLFPLLTDSLVRLRALEPTDLDQLTSWENDTALWATGSSTAPISRKRMWDYIEAYVPDIYVSGELRLAIHSVEHDNIVGFVELFDFDPHNRRAGIGLMIAPQWRHQGYATHALALTIDYASQFIGMHQLWATIAADNGQSMSLFKNAGFAICGRLRSWLRLGGSTYTDAYLLQRLFP